MYFWVPFTKLCYIQVENTIISSTYMLHTLEFLSERGLSGSVTYITCRMYPACTCGTVSPLTCSNLATLILMELLRHAEFDVSRRVILMVSSVTDIANLVQSQDTMNDYFIVTWKTFG